MCGQEKPVVFLWVSLADNRRRPQGTGIDWIGNNYGIGNYFLVSRRVKEFSTEFVVEEAKSVQADYVILDGCPLRVAVDLVLLDRFHDRLLVPEREPGSGVIKKFLILLPELATRPFEPE